MQEIIYTILQECAQSGGSQPYNRKTIISSVYNFPIKLTFSRKLAFLFRKLQLLCTSMTMEPKKCGQNIVIPQCLWHMENHNSPFWPQWLKIENTDPMHFTTTMYTTDHPTVRH